MEDRIKAAWLSVISNSILIILKLVIGIAIGAVSIIAEAIHSGIDLLASFIALFAVKKSGKPPDEKHPYGHGKVENVSATAEALLIFIAAFFIIAEAVDKLSFGAVEMPVGWGIVVMGISTAVNVFIAMRMYRVSESSRSPALEADAMHHRTDVYTSFGVMAGLVLISITGKAIIDPIIAIVVAVIIIKGAWDLTRESFFPLMDTAITGEEIARVKQVLEEFRGQYIEYHNLRTRRAGREIYIDLHLVTCSRMSVREGHDLSSSIEQRIEEFLPFSQVLIHAEPARGQRFCLACKSLIRHGAGSGNEPGPGRCPVKAMGKDAFSHDFSGRRRIR